MGAHILQTGFHTLQQAVTLWSLQRGNTKNAYQPEAARQTPGHHRPSHQVHCPSFAAAASVDPAPCLPIPSAAAAAPCAGSEAECCLAGPCLLLGKGRHSIRAPDVTHILFVTQLWVWASFPHCQTVSTPPMSSCCSQFLPSSSCSMLLSPPSVTHSPVFCCASPLQLLSSPIILIHCSC